MERSQSYAAFWPRYLREHAQSGTRWLHYVGTALSLVFIALAAATLNPWWLLGAPLAGYGFAWTGHAIVERNRPATFTHPLWSLVSDYRMFFLWVSGRLGHELSRAGLGEQLGEGEER